MGENEERVVVVVVMVAAVFYHSLVLMEHGDMLNISDLGLPVQRRHLDTHPQLLFEFGCMRLGIIIRA